MNVKNYDHVLQIQTGENQKGFLTSVHYHRYEPTPYAALEYLFTQYQITCSDRIVDFGCGKGRLNFYLHYFYGTTVIGIEMNERFFQEAMDNQLRYIKKPNVKNTNLYFYQCLAEEYEIDPLDNKFYFFNPFSVQVFMKVVNNILRSMEQTKREMELILYYPSEDYIFYLENYTSFELIKEIQLPGLYDENSNERFLIYRL
ncbi:class I SAM-dependent methyltransferase [Halalkalibacter urbisdiaboli]|uniref:class I SAM-dependent methyltransferase n=1 Tax=Halalkalibacter urbisdiaboli TaxID=1960589 RepID=UPI000B43F8AC|nr:methyltransferase [Halalkalibacter urbisdiaboli]